jgi:hypothetical protein
MKGHVRERGKGNWYAVLSVRDPQTGKRKVQWRSLPGCKGKREAQQECARILTEMQSGGYVAPDKTTVAQFLERWLAHIKTQVGASSFRRYRQHVRNTIIPALGTLRLAKLRRSKSRKCTVGSWRSAQWTAAASRHAQLPKFMSC